MCAWYFISKRFLLLCLFYILFSCNYDKPSEGGCYQPTESNGNGNGNGGDGRTYKTYYSINTINIDGSNESKITEVKTIRLSYPQYTADGSKIIYAGEGIWIMDADGGNKKRLIEGGEYPCFSPDGTKILYLRSFNVNDDIWIINTDGSNNIQLTDGDYCKYPGFSPDGTMIAYIEDAYNYISIMKNDGSGKIQITPAYDYVMDWDFSPDGTKIVFTATAGSEDNYIPDIYLIEIDETKITNLTNDDYYDYTARISPDGNKIIYLSHTESGFLTLNMMDIDATNKIILTQDADASFNPLFSPDGSKIAFHRNGQLNIMDNDGKNILNLAEIVNNFYDFGFSPDGSKLVYVKIRSEEIL
jgi:Tol biopolymer transport system component